ncbi:MAG: polymer-forming cytoskeletal protein [Mangrovibacterium sp.]
MFKKSNREIIASSEATISNIGKEMEGNGKLHSQGDIGVNGKFYGELSSDSKVIVGETGFVEGEISAKEVIVYGRVNGKVTSSFQTSIKPTGVIFGDVLTSEIAIETGGRLNGNCKNMEQPDNFNAKSKGTPSSDKSKDEPSKGESQKKGKQ